jgi:hypothetical protein
MHISDLFNPLAGTVGGAILAVSASALLLLGGQVTGACSAGLAKNQLLRQIFGETGQPQ